MKQKKITIKRTSPGVMAKLGGQVMPVGATEEADATLALGSIISNGLSISPEELAMTAPERGGAKIDVESGRAAVVEELIAMRESGKLKRSPEEYLRAKEFIELITEYPISAAVRIYEAERMNERAIEEAMERGRKSVLDSIRKRRELPRAMVTGAAAAAEVDYSKMSDDEFFRVRDRLKRRS